MLLVYVNSIDVCLLILLSRTSWLTLGLRVYRFSWIFNAIYLQTSIVCFPPAHYYNSVPVLTYFLDALLESESHSVVSDSLQPHGLYSTWNSPGQNTGVGSPSFSSGSSRPRNQTQVSCIAGRFFSSWATRDIYICVCVYICSFFPPLLQLCPCPHLFLGCIA